MINVNELTKRLLDKVFHGKLTERIASEGTGKDLFDEVQRNKKLLIDSGSLKKETTLKEIQKNEIPFSIPPTWEWVRFGDVISLTSGNDLQKDQFFPDNRTDSIPYITGASCVGDDGNLIINRFTDKQEANSNVGDILLTCKGTIGKISSNSIGKLHLARQLMGIRTFIDFDFTILYLKYIVGKLRCHANGLIPGIDRGTVRESLIPLPPLGEQKRIVMQLEDVFSQLDVVKNEQDKIADLSKKLEERIIGLAVQGKLVEQRPEEETGDKLLNQIISLKESLTKKVAIKKDRPLAAVSREAAPFSIPENWKWVRFGDLFYHNAGKALNVSNEQGKMMSYITTSNVFWNSFNLTHLKEMAFTSDEIERFSVKKGDLLIVEGGDFGRSAIWPYEYEMRIQNHIHRARPFFPVETKFFYYVMLFYKKRNEIKGRGIGLQGLSTNVLDSLAVPLPPLGEQKRIVAKLDELLPLCEKMAIVE